MAAEAVNRLLASLELASGETKRLPCPQCHNPSSFTISNLSGKLVWNCYAASCKLAGAKHLGLSRDDVLQARDLMRPNNDHSKPTAWSKPASFVEWSRSPVGSSLIAKYEIEQVLQQGYAEAAYDARTHRLAFMIYQDGILVDAIGRALTKGDTPKWLRFNRSECPLIDDPGSSTVVIVEDAFSACVLATLGVAGCALMGTHLSPAYLPYLKAYKLAYVCLDKDASKKALYMQLELSTYLTTKVRMLHSDIKDLAQGERRQLIEAMEH